MAELTTLARPYAEAAYQFASEAGELPVWEKALGFLAMVARDPAAEAFLFNPEVEQASKFAFLRDLGGDLLTPKIHNFLALLLENDRIELLPEIQQLFETSLRSSEGRIEVEVSSAVDLNESQVKALKEALKRRLGREVILETRLDPQLIGGMIVRAGDLVIDGSVRGQLDQLANTLRS